MFVVKIGGAEGNGMDSVLIDLAPRRDYVLVHGGSNEVDRLAEALGRPIRWITSPVVASTSAIRCGSDALRWLR